MSPPHTHLVMVKGWVEGSVLIECPSGGGGQVTQRGNVHVALQTRGAHQEQMGGMMSDKAKKAVCLLRPHKAPPSTWAMREMSTLTWKSAAVTANDFKVLS